jgi:hypothetical protein
VSGLRAITIVIALAARTAAADCEATRARIAADAARAHDWNLAWGLGFTGATVLQAAIAISPVSDRERDAMVIGAAKSGIGMMVHAILPLRIATPTSCAEAERILAKAARDERRLFFLNHFGGLALNLAGALILTERRSWRDGLISFAVGWPVGLLHAYSLPRGSWHVVTAMPVEGGAIVGVAGAF